MEIIRECPTWVEYIDDWGCYRIDWADMTWGKGGNKNVRLPTSKTTKARRQYHFILEKRHRSDT